MAFYKGDLNVHWRNLVFCYLMKNKTKWCWKWSGILFASMIGLSLLQAVLEVVIYALMYVTGMGFVVLFITALVLSIVTFTQSKLAKA